MLKAGAKILVPHPSEGFVGATVESAGAEIKCQADDGERLTVDAKKVAESDEKAFEGVADLTSLDVLNEATVVHTLRLRHKQQQVYSAVGDVLISVNPFEPALLGSSAFGRDVMKTYAEASGTALGKLPPHIFALAERAFSAMLGTGAPQAVVISGESGAGKTEGKRQCVLYLMARGTLLAGGESEGALERQLVQVNPLLEALGNASTTRNPNSSRFGQWLSVRFGADTAVLGGGSTPTCSRSRASSSAAPERNFHIFTQLLAGLTETESATLQILVGASAARRRRSAARGGEGAEVQPNEDAVSAKIGNVRRRRRGRRDLTCSHLA